MKNIFKHNSRTYFDVYNAFIQAYPTAPTWMFKEIAGMFDFQSELQNRIATDILYPSTRESAYSFAARCDYAPVEASGATATLTITLTSAVAKTIAVGHQFAGISGATGDYVIYEVTAAASSGGTDTITCYVEQKQSYTGINIGGIINDNDYADYPIDGYTNIIKSSISLTIDSLTWTRVDNFDDSISTDRHFVVIYQSSGKVRVQFGDGVNGLKPTLNDVIYANFSVTEGLIGKLAAGEITIDVDDDAQIDSVTNAAAASGGADSESIASILRNARSNARLRNMLWSLEDLEIAARASDSSVIKALGIAGTGTANIQIIPSGGGVAGGALLATVKAYTEALTQFAALPITATAASYVTPAITATASIRTGYVGATVLDLVEFAMTMTTCAFDNQIIEYYDDNGIDLCRTALINVIWSWAFTEDENDALAFIIDKWKDLLGTRDYREWGQSLEVGDLWIMGNSLYDYGVDVFSLTAPVANTTTTSTQIIDTGILNVT